jgi:hypothetical protein
MRNKILVTLWMLVGAFAALWIGAIPMLLAVAIMSRFVGRHSPLLGIITVPSTLMLLAYGATWFKHLFYKGMLWGYRPDKDS